MSSLNPSARAFQPPGAAVDESDAPDSEKKSPSVPTRISPDPTAESWVHPLAAHVAAATQQATPPPFDAVRAQIAALASLCGDGDTPASLQEVDGCVLSALGQITQQTAHLPSVISLFAQTDLPEGFAEGSDEAAVLKGAAKPFWEYFGLGGLKTVATALDELDPDSVVADDATPLAGMETDGKQRVMMNRQRMLEEAKRCLGPNLFGTNTALRQALVKACCVRKVVPPSTVPELHYERSEYFPAKRFAERLIFVLAYARHVIVPDHPGTDERDEASYSHDSIARLVLLREALINFGSSGRHFVRLALPLTVLSSLTGNTLMKKVVDEVERAPGVLNADAIAQLKDKVAFCKAFPHAMAGFLAMPARGAPIALRNLANSVFSRDSSFDAFARNLLAETVAATEYFAKIERDAELPTGNMMGFLSRSEKTQPPTRERPPREERAPAKPERVGPPVASARPTPPGAYMAQLWTMPAAPAEAPAAEAPAKTPGKPAVMTGAPTNPSLLAEITGAALAGWCDTTTSLRFATVLLSEMEPIATATLKKSLEALECICDNDTSVAEALIARNPPQPFLDSLDIVARLLVPGDATHRKIIRKAADVVASRETALHSTSTASSLRPTPVGARVASSGGFTVSSLDSPLAGGGGGGWEALLMGGKAPSSDSVAW